MSLCLHPGLGGQRDIQVSRATPIEVLFSLTASPIGIPEDDVEILHPNAGTRFGPSTSTSHTFETFWV